MSDFILFTILPYVAVLVGLAVTAGRFFLGSRKLALSSQVTTPEQPFWGATLWHFGLLVLLAAHVIGFLSPADVLIWNSVPLRLIVLEVTGLILGLLTLIGLITAFWHNLANRTHRAPSSALDKLLLLLLLLEVLSGIGMAIFFRWGSSWYATVLVPYLRTLLTLHPDVAAVSALHWLIKLHIVNAFLIVLLLPFTSLLDALLAPLFRTFRNWRLVHTLVVVLVGLFILGGNLFIGLKNVGLNQDYAPIQPIAYSHKTHAGDNQIACLYCHFGAEKSRHAGIPPANVCMNCHAKIKVNSPEVAKIQQAVTAGQPIPWVRVHRLPDFAYFNHAQHVGAGKLACQKCHGPVETMVVLRQESPLTMGWCIDCHRASDVAVHGANDSHKVSDIGGTDCAKCHY